MDMKVINNKKIGHLGKHPRRLAERQHISENNFRNIVDCIGDGFFQLDTEGYFTFVNKIIVDRSKISEEQFYTLHFLDVVSPEDHERAQNNFMKVIAGKNAGPYELNYSTADGHHIIVEINTNPIYDGKQIVGVQGVSRDITKRRRAEQALQESEARFRILHEASFGGIGVNDKGVILEANQALSDMTGYDYAELIGMDGMKLIAPECYDYVKNNILSEYEKPYEAVGIRKDGSRYPLEIQGKMIPYQGKKLRVTEFRDISERKKTQEELKKTEKRYRTVLENCSDAMLLADEKGNLVEANRMAEELLGYNKEELMQMHYTQLHPAEKTEEAVTTFHHIARQGHGCLQDGAILRKDGRSIPVDITAVAIEYDGRKILQASFRDISDHKLMMDNLEGLVRERTSELSEKNDQLMKEIRERKHAEAALRKKAKDLLLNARKLEELNTALKVLLKQREHDRTDLETKVLSNVRDLLLPYLDEMKKGRLDQRRKIQLSILETNLNNIISPFTQKLSAKYSGFTPREMQVANLVRQGKSSKEIAEFMGVSRSAIHLHRNHIRKKMGLITQKINLRSHLISISQ